MQMTGDAHLHRVLIPLGSGGARHYGGGGGGNLVAN